jgi:hypothetical protein
MADRTDLEAAAAAGVIGAEQVQPLHDFLARLRPAASAAKPAVSGEEDLRFIRNFHDVFLAIGIVLFAIGMAVGIATYVAEAPNPQQGATLTGALCAGAVSVMWLLGELFARRRRLFLPAIAIVSSMTLFAVVSAATLYTGAVLGRGFDANLGDFQGMPPELRNGILVALGFAVIAPLAFYVRFRLPFSLGLMGGAFALFVIVASMIANLELTLRLLPTLYLALGILLFLAGVGYDVRDPARTTRFSDNGFWLHLAAAPFILNGALGLVGQLFTGHAAAASPSAAMLAAGGGPGATAQAAATLVVIAFLGFVSLLINRRALVVSALLTTGIAIGVLMNAAGLGAGSLAAATLISLGAFVLILGASWHIARRTLLGWVRPEGMWARIFPPEIAAAA